jgi:large subunit ribosomal protein L10
MDRSQKAESVAALNAVFNEVGLVVVTRNLGLSVKQSTDLRTKMRDAGATYKVAKNRLAKLALKDTQYEGLEEHLTGPTALAWSTDPIAAAKAAVEFAKTNDKLEIVGGAMGSTQLNADGIRPLPRCRASTSCGRRSWAWSTRPPPRWRSWSTPPRRSSPASSGPTGPRKRRKRFFEVPRIPSI